MNSIRLYSPGPTGLRRKKKFWIEPGESQEFLIGQGRNTLLILRSGIARNIYHLLYRKMFDDAFHDDELNCHGAAAIALGETTNIDWLGAFPRGVSSSIQDVLEHMPLPCGVQIHENPKRDDPIHSAILLGKSLDHTPLAFHKGGCDPMELCTLERIFSMYSRYRKNLTFYSSHSAHTD